MYLNNVNGTLKWGWVYTGVIDDYKFLFQYISGNDYKILIGSTMVDTGYIAQYVSGDNYIIKNGNQYLQTFGWGSSSLNGVSQKTYLEDYTNTMIENNNKAYFIDTTFTASVIYLKVKLFSNIKIPGAFRTNRHQLTNYATGQPTNTFLLYPDYLRSSNGIYFLIMQRDGNLVIHHKNSNNNPEWESETNTYGRHGNALVILSDGNVAVYTGNRPSSPSYGGSLTTTEARSRTNTGTPFPRPTGHSRGTTYGWQSETYNSNNEVHKYRGGVNNTNTIIFTYSSSAGSSNDYHNTTNPTSVIVYPQDTGNNYMDWYTAEVINTNTVRVHRDYVPNNHGWGQSLNVNISSGYNTTIEINNSGQFTISNVNHTKTFQ